MTRTVDSLQLELRRWKDAGVRPRLFLRDDDCVDVTVELETMARFIDRRKIPLLLAVIPKFATNSLGKFVGEHKLITPAVHGYSHTNYAGENQKKCEYCDNRSYAEMLEEMKLGREILEALFGTRLSTIFVPPWNRIGEKADGACSEAEFTAISGFGWKPQMGNVRRVNTHVDVIDWKAGKAGKSYETLVNEMRVNLVLARENDFAPVGILTHHLVHADWEMLGAIFDLLGDIQLI